MRQVPKKQPLLIGDGKLARHWAHFMEIKGIPFHRWSRSSHTTCALPPLLNSSNIIFLAISDPALLPFFQTHLQSFPGDVFHFSGNFYDNRIKGCHPLMTFSNTLYEKSVYESMALIFDHPEKSWFFENWSQQTYCISPEQKALYHSLCVLGGNFSQILWSAASTGLQKMGLPLEALAPFLQQSLTNYLSDPKKALTGPLDRGDLQTIASHRKALLDKTEESLYSAFVHYHSNMKTIPHHCDEPGAAAL